MLNRLSLLFSMLTFLLVSSYTASSTATETTPIYNQQLEAAKEAYFANEQTKSINILTPLAEKELPEALYYLGLIYSAPSFRPEQHTQAIKYLLLAAKKNHVPAMFKIGLNYDQGIGVQLNPLTALDWYRKSEKVSRNNKLNNLTFTTQPNFDTNPKPFNTILTSIEKSANQGDAEAQFQLARIYDLGQEVTYSIEQAFKWYKTAAENNHHHSQFILGYLYCRGLGTNKDKITANYWLKKSNRKAICY
jgi:TPR repeat protein